MIANARHYGGRFVLAPRTGILERGLEAILFKSRSRAVLAGQLMSLAAGRLEPRAAHGGDVEMLPLLAGHRHGASIRCPTQIDGDVFGTTPLEVDAGTAELRLIVPSTATGSGNPGDVNHLLTKSANAVRQCRPEAAGGGAGTAK